jgi:hypothetical protein
MSGIIVSTGLALKTTILGPDRILAGEFADGPSKDCFCTSNSTSVIALSVVVAVDFPSCLVMGAESSCFWDGTGVFLGAGDRLEGDATSSRLSGGAGFVAREVLDPTSPVFVASSRCFAEIEAFSFWTMFAVDYKV